MITITVTENGQSLSTRFYSDRWANGFVTAMSRVLEAEAEADCTNASRVLITVEEEVAEADSEFPI